MKVNVKIVFFICLFQLSSSVFGQLQNIRIPFEHLSTREGLISNRVTSIIKDSLGFYWYATSLGLNRHDGNHLELFRHEEENLYTIPDDDIDHLIVANKFTIAGLTSSGKLFLYDYRDPMYNRVKRVPLASRQNVSFRTKAIASDGEALYAINKTGDIIRVNLSTYTSYVFLPAQETVIDGPHTAIYQAGCLWVGAENGLFCINPSTCRITKIDLSFYASKSDGDVSVTVIEPYDENHFLVSSARSSKNPFKGIIMYNFTDRTDTPLCLYGAGVHLDNYPIDIVKKINGSTLFLRVHTVSRFIYDIETHEWDTLVVRINHTRYLNSSSLNCVASEQNGRYRIGSNQGIFIHLPEISMFEEYYPQNGKFYAQQWTAIYRENTKNLYVGNPGAINVYNTKTKKITSSVKHPCVQDHHRANQQPSLIELDSTRLLILASFLYTYDIHQNTFTLIENDSASQLPAHIQSNLFPYTTRGSDCFFIRDGRLYQIGLETLKIQPLPIYDTRQQEVFFDASGLAFDVSGNLWMTTFNRGLVRCRLGQSGYQSYVLYENKWPLNDIIIDSSNIAWIATSGNGLVKVIIDTLSQIRYEHFSKKEGYLSADLHQLIEDNNGRIWSTSSYGINYFDKNSGNVFNFSKDHGIAFPHNFFRGKTRDQAGNIYVSGGINIVKIDPKKFRQESSPPPVYVTQFQINNKPVASFCKDTSITLTARQNNFSFQLSAINHIHANLNKYKYKMEKFHSDWISIDRNQLFIPFSNLEAGTYTFKAIASNHQGVWNTKGINIHLRILPYWYETWWFRSTAFLAILALIYYFFRLRTERLLALQRIDIEKKLALEAERSRISRDMHDDLGSGLSAIHLLSNFVKENAQEKYPEFSHEVDQIQKSSENLNQAIREIIWTVNSRDDSLQSLILFIQRFSHEMHEKSRIPVYVHTSDPIPDIQLDGVRRKHIYLCVKEAVNNALKHGSPTEISIHIHTDPKTQISIRVSDNGIGFLPPSSNKITNGNGLSNMQTRMADIGGIAEISSSPGNTVVHFQIPV